MADKGGPRRTPAPALEAERVRRLIERGLDRYGRGELPEAIAEWERALGLDDRNAEARELISFVKQELLGPEEAAGDFAKAPLTDGTGRTGWGLADAPAPRPPPEPDTPPPSGPARTIFAWGGRGRVEPVGIPGEPERPGSEEEITEPGPQAMADRLDDLGWSGANPHETPTAPGPPDGDAVPQGFEEEGSGPEGAGGSGRSRRVTVESPVPALLAATMPEEARGARPWASEPESLQPVAADETRRVGGARSGEPSSSPLPVSGEELLFVDIAGDPGGHARKRAAELVDRARSAFKAGDNEAAAEAAEFALSEGERAPPPGIAEVIEPARPLFHRVFQAHVGSNSGVPAVNLSAPEISAMTFDHRTGFILSRIDGVMTLEELLDVSGMGSFETFRILSSLLRAGIVSIG